MIESVCRHLQWGAAAPVQDDDRLKGLRHTPEHVTVQGFYCRQCAAIVNEVPQHQHSIAVVYATTRESTRRRFIRHELTFAGPDGVGACGVSRVAGCASGTRVVGAPDGPGSCI